MYIRVHSATEADHLNCAGSPSLFTYMLKALLGAKQIFILFFSTIVIGITVPALSRSTGIWVCVGVCVGVAIGVGLIQASVAP